jgi:alkylhydroperoxidase/carboxymuconolactone decarboxylase family protein YurZ
LTGAELQLQGHLGIAMNVGLTKEELGDYIAALKEKVDATAAERAGRILAKVLEERAG